MSDGRAPRRRRRVMGGLLAATVILPLVPALWTMQVTADVHDLQCVRDRLTAMREHAGEQQAASTPMLALAEELSWRHTMSECSEDLRHERKWFDELALAAIEHDSAPASASTPSADAGARLEALVGAALHRSRAAERTARWLWLTGSLAGLLSGLALWLRMRSEWSASPAMAPLAISPAAPIPATPGPAAGAPPAPARPLTAPAPAVETPVFRPMATSDPARAAGQADGSWMPLSGRVLVIEDNPINQRVTQRQLLELGLSVEIVDNAESGLQRLRQSHFDAVLMDLQLPGMDGLAATRHWRTVEQAEGRRRLPIIAITANATGSDRQACYEAGMDGYQAKPARLADLHRVLMRHVGPDRVAQATAKPGEALAPSPSPLLSPSPSPSPSAAGNPHMGPQHLLDHAATLELTDPQLWVALRRETATTDPRMLEELIADLRRQAEVTLSDLQEALAAGDRERLRAGAHRLKGSAGMLGLPRLAACAKAVEFAAKAGDDRVAEHGLRSVRLAYGETLADPQVLALI